MKQISGIAVNIHKKILGKVARKPLNRFLRSGSDEIRVIARGYPVLITSNEFNPEKHKRISDIPIVHSVKDITELKEGNVVLIEPSGGINILYEKESIQNTIMVTEKCNCACIMCPQEIKKEDDSKTEFNLKLISLMNKSTKFLALTGGEPTLVGDDLFRLLMACKENLPNTPLIILTNGILFSNFEYAKKLVLLQNQDLTIAIPLYADIDNMHDYIIQTKGFHKTIQGIYNLALLKQKIEIRVVITNVNYRRLPSLAEFIYHNFPFVVHIAFMGMETRALAEKNIDLVWIDPYDYMPYLKRAVNYLDRAMMDVSIYNQQLCVLPKDLWPYSRKSISSWKNIYLEECQSCLAKDKCGGLFSSSEYKHSLHIKRM